MEFSSIYRANAARVFLTLVVAVVAWTPVTTFAALLDEIKVSVQRREQLIQDVPVAVTAYDSEQLTQLQVTETLDMTRLVPNVIGHNNTGLGTANAYSIRGLNNTESIATFDPPVGSYIDDIYVARQNANNFTLFDVDRIEVLRGPQGTLFGRNTTGGAIRIIMKKPAEEVGGYFEAGVGSYDRFETRASVDLPVNDQIFTKFSGYFVDDDGYVDNLTTGEKINGENNYGLRAAMMYNINDELTWNLSGEYMDDDHANLLNAPDGGSRVSNTGLRNGGQPFFGLIRGDKQTFNLGNEVITKSLTSVLDWTVDDTTLSIITGWRDLTQKFALDFFDGGGPTGAFTIVNDGQHTQFTQEVKINSQVNDRFSYVAGLYYMNEDNETDFADLFDIGIAVLTLSDRLMVNNTESFAVYFQGDLNVTDEVTLTAGIRYTDEDKDIGYRDFTGGTLTTSAIQGFGTSTSIATELWTPRLAVEWAPSDEMMFYLSATRGFKSGGWNARASSADQIQPFTAEKVWNYEAGLRTEWLDNRLRVNATAFYLDVSSFQLPSAVNSPSGGIIFITKNFADLENMGVELEVLFSPVDDLTVWSNIGYQDSEYTNLGAPIVAQQQNCLNGIAMMDAMLIDDNCGQGIVGTTGKIAPPVRAPEYTLNVGFNYTWRIGSDYELVPSAYLYAVDDHSVGTNGGPGNEIDGYSTYNASLTLNNTDNDWSLVLQCKNCNDRNMKVSTLAGTEYFQDPRTWRLNFRKGFGGS